MFSRKGVNIFTSFLLRRYNIALLVVFFGLVACDPCRELADKICQCQKTDEERRQCTNALGLAGQQEYFKQAKDQETCTIALKKNCSCPQLNNDEDQECGMYRKLIKK